MKRHVSLLILMLFVILSQGIAFSSPIDVRQGEQVTLTLKLVNVGDVALSNLKAEFSNAPEWISPSISPTVSLSASETENDNPLKPESERPCSACSLPSRSLPNAILPFTFTADKYTAPLGESNPLTLKISDASGLFWTKEIVLNVLSRPMPKSFALKQNYPNPFNPETWIPYQLKEPSDVTIRIFNLRGQLVRTLELGHKEADFYVTKDSAAYWDGRNDFGERVASGVYFYHLQAGKKNAVRKMLIIK